MNIMSVLYCVVIHRYTQCYTSVILGVILLLLYINTQCYTEVYNVWITEEYTRYTVLYSNAFYTVMIVHYLMISSGQKV